MLIFSPYVPSVTAITAMMSDYLNMSCHVGTSTLAGLLKIT